MLDSLRRKRYGGGAIMKFYLSSYHLGDHSEKLVRLVGSNKRAAIIPNAIDFSTDEERRTASREREESDLRGLGFEPEELDLRDYFGKKEALREKLKEFGLAWVRGGNTFILRRAMAESGLDELLREFAHGESFVYGGYSAGVCVLAPTLKGVELTDDPKIIPSGYRDQTIWEGLGLFSYCVVPHYQSNHPESPMAEETVKYYEENHIPFKTLRDGEVIVESL